MAKASFSFLVPKKRVWKALASTSAWLCSVIAVFVFPPPQNVSADPSRVFVEFAAFLVAILVGISAVIASRFSKKQNANLWITVCCLSLVLGISSFFSYQNQRERYTASYEGIRVVIGSEFTEAGRLSAGPGITADQLVMDAAGQPAQIWTAESIRHNALLLQASYLLTIFTLAGSIVFLLQALDCATKNR